MSTKPLRAANAVLLSYLTLFGLTNPLDGLLGLARLFEGWPELAGRFTAPLGRALFDLDAVPHPTGSADTAFHWVLAFSSLVLAFPIAALVSRLGEPARQKARHAAEAYVRLSLALVLISYGLVKVFPAQFPPPSIDRLMQRFGDASSMGLLWTFMGASPAYTFLAGAAELAGGLLLTMRRTALLGSLLSTVVLANVVALNFCYDVPVKLYSAHLLGMALVIAVRDAPRLWAVLVANVSAPPAPRPALFTRPALHRAALGLRTALVLGLTLPEVQELAASRTEWDRRVEDPLHGLWKISGRELGTEEAGCGPSEVGRLRQELSAARYVVIDVPGFVALLREDGARVRYALRRDDETRTLSITQRFQEEVLSTLHAERPVDGALTLRGNVGSTPALIVLERSPVPEMTLGRRPLQLVQEYPFQR